MLISMSCLVCNNHLVRDSGCVAFLLPTSGMRAKMSAESATACHCVAPCGWCVARKHRPIVHAVLPATTPVSHQSLQENQQTRRGSAHQGLVLLPHRSSVATRCGHERRQPVRHVMQAPVDGAWALDHRAVDEARPSHASLKIRPLGPPQGPVLSAVRALRSDGIYLLAFE